MIKSFFLKFPQPLSTLRPLPQPLSPCTLGCLNMFCRFCLCHLIFINDDFLAEMTISPKRRTLLLRVNTGTLNIGLGRAPGTSLHTPAEESSTPPCHTGTQWWESCSLQSPVLYPCPGLVLSMPHCNVKMSVNVALQVVSSWPCLMLHCKWCTDTIVLAYDLGCIPYQICHWAICGCPGHVIHSLLCQWLSHQVPGPCLRIPSPAGSACVPASTQQWPILGMANKLIRQIWEDTGRVSIRMVNLCWIKCKYASSDQHSWKVKWLDQIDTIPNSCSVVAVYCSEAKSLLSSKFLVWFHQCVLQLCCTLLLQSKIT